MIAKNSKNWFIAAIIGVALLLAVTYANYQYAKNNPGGNDFLVHWEGTRSFLIDGQSPYSDATATKIQTLAYGHPAQSGEHELRVAYPLYSIFLFTPFAIIKDFTAARAIWMTFLEFCLVFIAILSMRSTYWKPNLWILATIFLFMFVSYHGARPLINGNAVIFITLLILISLLLIRGGKDEIAGIVLAFSTIKPQNVILLIVFLLFWAMINKRYRLIGYFLGTMILLVGFSSLLIPDWILQDFREILRYPTYNPPLSLGAAMTSWWGAIGTRLSYALTALLAILLGFEWWKGRYADGRQFLWLGFFTLAISQWIGIQTDPGNFILLYPGLIFSFSLISSRWKGKANLLVLITLLTTTIGIWALFLATLQKSYQPIQSPVLFLPMPLIALIFLYWVKWWVSSANIIDYSGKVFEI